MSISGSRVTILIPASDLTCEELQVTAQAVSDIADKLVVVTNYEDTTGIDTWPGWSSDNYIYRVNIPYRVGKAQAVRDGLNFILDAHVCDIVVQMDGHGKQPASSVRILCESVVESGVDMAIFDRYAMQSLQNQEHRAAISKVFSEAVESVTGSKFRDTVCGTRAYKNNIAEVFANESHCYGYALEIEELFLASRAGARVISQSVDSNKQADGTNAEKIMDNFIAVASYSDQRGNLRRECSHAISKIKARQDFEMSIESSTYSFQYIGDIDGVDDAYVVAR